MSRISVARAAEIMGVSPQFIRVGLQQGLLPFGTAVSISGGKYTYYISPELFSQYTGASVESLKGSENNE